MSASKYLHIADTTRWPDELMTAAAELATAVDETNRLERERHEATVQRKRATKLIHDLCQECGIAFGTVALALGQYTANLYKWRKNPDIDDFDEAVRQRSAKQKGR